MMMMMPTAMTQRRLFCTRVRKDQMEKSCAGKGRNPFWFVIFASLVFWIFLFSFHSSTLMSRKNEASSLAQEYARAIVSRETKSLLVTEDDAIDSAGDKVVKTVNHQFSENKTEHGETVHELETVGEKETQGTERLGRVSVTAKEIRPVKKLANGESQSVLVKQPSELKKRIDPVNRMPIKEIEFKSDLDPCMGRYIYVHKLPSQFNDDMLKNCRSLSMWTDMCRFMSNAGLGPPLGNSERVYSNTGWFATNQFALDVIFHNRLKHYRCLTENSSMASAIFVPFYAGLDVGRYLWGFNTTIRDSAALDLFRWLTARPEWKVMGGRDHFLVAGRISWDFRRVIDDKSDWGNKLLLLPEAKNMSLLLIESSPWHSNDFAIPYPTYFHPSRDSEVWQWQNRMRRQRRRYLFSFAGAPRPHLEKSIRSLIIEQCKASRRKCKLLECDRRASKCHNPSSVMKLFQTSIFCLQPPGDSYTRRSAFDSILAGCIPVFFHPGSAYVQYIWHLPKNYTKYSVFIPEEDVREGKVSLEKWLRQIPKEEVRAMRKEVIRLIPRVIYAAPNSRLETLQDAFDLAVQGVIQRVNSIKRELKEGKNPNEGYEEENSWKYNLFGTEGKHEWDPFFFKAKGSKVSVEKSVKGKTSRGEENRTEPVIFVQRIRLERQ